MRNVSPDMARAILFVGLDQETLLRACLIRDAKNATAENAQAALRLARSWWLFGFADGPPAEC
jgi:hypothetical protein